MPTFLVHRTVGSQTDDEVESAVPRVKAAVAQMPGVRWVRSYYAADEGKIYCEYEAPDLETLMEHARRAGIPFDAGHVVRELRPEMFD